jgi:hypothetical protein
MHGDFAQHNTPARAVFPSPRRPASILALILRFPGCGALVRQARGEAEHRRPGRWRGAWPFPAL